MATRAEAPPVLTTRHRPHVLLMMTHWIDEIHRGVAEYAAASGWILNACMRTSRVIPAWWQGDGVIAQPRDAESQAWLAERNVPMVSIEPLWRPPGTGQVLGDPIGIGRLAAQHFHERGFRDMAVVSVAPESYDEAGQMEGIREVAAASGMVIHTIARTGSIEHDLMALPKPIGLFAATSHDFLIELIERCESCGMMVPEQVAVLGINDNAMVCDLAPVPLSCINNSFEHKGVVAARMLDRMMAGHPPPEEPIVNSPQGVTLRRSTDVLAVKDPRLMRALRFISEHYREPITIEQVAESAECPRRRLHDLFREELDRSMLTEITRLRISHACKLLRDTDLKVDAVAVESGFSSRHHLRAALHRTKNSTPRAYRQRFTTE
jgi:LacI family transcriptional regulator